MSLDVYLKKNVKDDESKSYNEDELNHLQGDYEIQKSNGGEQCFVEWMKHLPNGWRRIANKFNPDWEEANEQVYWANITHNLGKMAEAAGIYKHLWRPEEIDIETASQLIKPLTIGLGKLRAKPEFFKTFDAPNGWGLYIHFVPFVEEYLAACKEHPDAIIEVDR